MTTEVLKKDIKPNELQQKCIDNINGQYLVLAGPGTGKTFTVSRRIENMINKGINPEKILCLTFSDTAANEMKKKINELLDKNDSRVNIYTYHSFCNEIISKYPEEFEIPENYKLIPDSVSTTFIHECINELNPKAFRTENNDPYYYTDNILKGINDIKQNRFNKEHYFYNMEHNQNWIPELKRLAEERQEKIANNKKVTQKLLDSIERLNKQIEKANELWSFYEKYTEKMVKYRYIDFNDMITMVLEKFENDKKFLSDIANNYEYLLVDEYQDTNKPQNDIIFSLTHGMDNANVFVVGDDDQIIYTFQGARLDSMEKFLKEFPKTEVICLKESMRSTKSILDTARMIAIQDEKRLEANEEFKSKYNISKKLEAKNDEILKRDKKVRFYKYSDAEQENTEIVKEIEELVNSDNCPLDKDGNKNLSEIAILTRSNSELQDFANRLKERNIKYELKDGKNIFLIQSVIIMFYYMQILVNAELHSDKILKILITPPFNINLKDYALIYKIKSKHKSLIDCMREIKPEDCMNYTTIEHFINNYDELKNYMANECLHNIVLEIGAKTGIFNYYLNTDINTVENIAGLKKLIDSAKSISEIDKTKGLVDFTNYLETALIGDEEINTEKSPVKMNAVQLTTYHNAKGKEYEYVYMPALFRNKWESSTKSIKPVIPLNPEEAKTDDEYKEQKRRDCIKLMYVGMTRAKHTLRLSYYNPVNSQMKLTSIIENIDSSMFDTKEFEQDEQSYINQMKENLVKKEYDNKSDIEALVEVKINKVFSPTYLNVYLNCHRQFFYSKILDFDSQSDISDAGGYGSAVHNACKYMLEQAYINKKYPTKEEFINAFKKNMQTETFSTYEQKQIHLERGIKALEKFYHHITDTPIKNIYEFEKEHKIKIDGYDFKGYIDRIDKNEDGTFSIYDYKTGKAKDKKQIDVGKRYENYYNQIGFYKYIFETETGNEVSKTEFIYPEHPENNFVLALTKEDCEQIKDKYIQSIKDIKSCKFEPCENKNKKDSPCEFCGYKEYCNIDTNF